MKKISKEHSEIILREMCLRVGVSYEDMDFSKENWYWDHEWSREEENDFIKWLAHFLAHHKYSTKKRANHEAEKIVFNYGWKTKV